MPIPLFAARFFFIRHGESVANKAKLFAGQMDVELTDKGKQDVLLTFIGKFHIHLTGKQFCFIGNTFSMADKEKTCCKKGNRHI